MSPEATRNSRRISRPLVAAVAFLIIIGLVTTGWIILKEFEVQKSVYAKILDQNLAMTRNQFRLFLEPFNDHLETLSRWRDAGMLPTDQPRQLQDLVVPLLDATDQISGAYFYSGDGRSLLLVRRGDGWSIIAPADPAITPQTRQWLDLVSSQPDSLAAKPTWSHYLTLPGDDRQGLLISRSDGGMVLALGLLEDDLDRFTATAPITRNGFLIRRFADGQIAWLTPQTGNRLDITDTGDLLTSGRPEHQIIGQALMEWGRRGRPYQEPFRFRQNKKDWWCTFFPAKEGTDPGELGLIAPASDLGRHLETVTGRVTLLLAGLLALAMTVVVVVAFDYRNKWWRFARRRHKAPATEEELRELIAGGENNQVEFKSTMRWNLHADKPGKEIELAWLKSVVGYLNTDGGNLVIGVQDDGTVLGIEADKFQNEDKFILHFDNLVKQHIGLEFAAYIKASFHTLGDKRVFLINCGRCEEPVYLKNGDDETFYIRVGASTRKLPISKINDYLKEREQ